MIWNSDYCRRSNRIDSTQKWTTGLNEICGSEIRLKIVYSTNGWVWTDETESTIELITNKVISYTFSAQCMYRHRAGLQEITKQAVLELGGKKKRAQYKICIWNIKYIKITERSHFVMCATVSVSVPISSFHVMCVCVCRSHIIS